MFERRTDLALEAREIWSEGAGGTSPDGLEEETCLRSGFLITTVRITNEQGEKVLCKPRGTYITVELGRLMRREESAFSEGASVLCDELKKLLSLKEGDTVLVVGLGNPLITPDAVGHDTVRNTLATRHLTEQMPETFSAFRSVAVLEPGVVGTTGIESAEVIRAVCERVRPSAVIAVDALASRRMDRVCRTVQLADTGIVPGSGVGNARAALNRETLGIPVIAVGVPTVVDAATLAADIARESGAGELDAEALGRIAGSMIVTPKDIDANVADISKLVGYGINLALHPGLTVEDVDMLI